ncbi:MAG: hypothetical protein QF724_10565, partial [Planctomycetota bacterium]|nr:hypothetical protein [Planctomycetota bacterium]
DRLPNPAVRAFDIDPADEDHILVGTGDRSRYGGSGLYETEDGGLTWEQVSLPISGNPYYFYKLAYQPGSGGRVLAASDRCLFLSTDNGATWSVVLSYACYDFVWDPSNPQRAYALSERLDDGIYRSLDGGQSWVELAQPPVPGPEPWERAHIAICRDDPGTVAMVGAKDKNINGVYITRNADTADPGAVSWTEITAGGPQAIDVSQSSHALALAIKPDDPDWIFLGSKALAESTDGGATWSIEGSGALDHTHSDQTQLAFFPQWDDVIWMCNDGGIYWDDLACSGPNCGAVTFIGNEDTGLALSQIDYADADRDVIGIGLQDNGTLLQEGVGSSWWQIRAGDGVDLAIVDPEAGDIWYGHGYESGDNPWHIYREDAGSDTDTGNPHPGKWGLRMFYDMWSEIMFSFAIYDVISIPEDLSSPWTTVLTSPTGDRINQVWGSDVNWVGLDYRTLFLSYYVQGADETRDFSICDNYGVGSWVVETLTDLAPAGGYVMNVAPSYRWGRECWVALASPAGSAKVLRIRPDYSVEDLTANLASLNAVNAIAVTPFNSDILYAGTDFGVFRTTNGGQSWEPFQDGLPIVQVTDMEWVPNDSQGWSHRLVASTYGRGVFSHTITAPPILYVMKDATGSEDGSFEHPYQTLTAAINAAPTGAILALLADTFAEPQTIDKDLRLETWAGTTLVR